jgi:hypothetical protein
VHARLTYLCELLPTDARLVKYDRAQELECFEAIHMKSEFKGKLTAAEFPLLPGRVGRAPREDDSEGEGVMPDGLQMIKAKKARAAKVKAKPRRVVATDSDEEDEVR